MVRRCWLIVATLVLGGCPPIAVRPSSPAPVDDTAVRIRVAQAEARRAGGAEELAEIAAHGAKHERLIALRGLGRIGGAAPTLLAALGDSDPDVVGAAAAALGVAAALDDTDLGATVPLLAVLQRAGGPVVEALGRAGTAAAQPALADALTDARLAELAALALARHGRRKIALVDPARRALVAAAASGDPGVRYAAVYALAREHEPPNDPAVTAVLVARLGDPLSEVRAQALAGLTRRKAIASVLSTGVRLDAMLLDRDWRVAVEAVRALADSDDGKDAIAATIMRRYGELERGDVTAAQVILEGEKALAGAAQRPIVATALNALTTRAPASSSPLPALTRGWIECLAIAARIRSDADPDLAAIGRCGLADHLRLPLVAELVTANVGSLATRRAALARLLGHTEARVRAAGLGALAAMWTAGEAGDQREAQAALVGALAAHEPITATAAVDAAAELYDAIAAGDHGWLDAAVISRAAAERDPELGSALLELIGKRGLAAGAEACRTGLAGDPVRAKAGAGCLKALGVAPPTVAAAAAVAPPVDVISVIGKRVRWHLTTSRGDVVVQLRPDVAPWAVATIVELTRKGFYDSLEFHRVVPNFVVQGGDPTESGSGGPGFTIPAEPASLLDGAGYLAGGVGIADAGRDSGGSQWFVMHSRAPHLDGRYTWVGTVESGQKAAEALLIGDRVLHATVDVVPAGDTAASP